MKKFTFFKLFSLLIGVMLTGNVLAQTEEVIYTTGFENSESFTSSTTYNNTTIRYQGPSGQQWGSYFGTVSTTGPITGSQSMQMRFYTATPSNLGYAFTNFDLPNVTKVTFKALNTSSNNVTVSYSTNGGSSYTGTQTFTLATSSADFTYNISATGEFPNVRLRFMLTPPASPTSGSRITFDNISVYGMVGSTPTVATPTFSIPGGYYYSTQNVEISTTTADATIYYTTDGSDPDNNSTEYTGAIPVNSTTTLKAIGYATGFDPSSIATAVYTFPVEVSDIATLRGGTQGGALYRLTGEAVLTFQTIDNHVKYIQDATGAIMIYDLSGTITTLFDLYDGITGLTGSLTSYNSMLEFVPVTDPGSASSTGNTVTPIDVTLANLTTDYQAKLVKVLNTTITETGNFAVSTNYTLTDGSKGTGTLRTAYTDLDYLGTEIPEIPQDLTGVVLQFNTSIQLVPRSTSDFAVADIPWPVTFYVDMTDAGSFTDVKIAGSLNSWTGESMTLESDNIYSFTTGAIFNVDDVIEFKFQKDDNGIVWEQDPNRTYTVVAGTNIYYAVWNVMLPAEISWANVQWPESGEIDPGGDFNVYAQVYANGLTGNQGNAPNLNSWIGYSSTNTNPDTWTNWVEAAYNLDNGNNEEYTANIGTEILTAGTYYYASRFKLGLAGYVFGGYSAGGGGFWDGSSYISGVLTINVAEPGSHVTGFNAQTDSYSAITVSWIDSDADGYLIKGSNVSYDDIVTPVDGTAEADGGLVKNIASGIQTYQFTGLTASTPYYFKIYPYNGTGTVINYKLDGTVPQATATTSAGPVYVTGDFGFTAVSGNWVTLSNWKQWNGSGWNTTPAAVPTTADNVFIIAGNTCIVEASGKNCNNLTIETGSKLYTSNTTMSSPRYINVLGNILCDGTIGNGNNVDDVISFNINGISCTISGNGSFTANRMRKNAGTAVSTLSFNIDAQLRYNGDALYNATTFGIEITINSGKLLDISGNGASPAGNIVLKDLTNDDKLTVIGNVTVSGTLTNGAGTAGLVINSDASGTGSLISSNSVNATVQRYLTQTDYHYIASPVAAQNISPEFIDVTQSVASQSAIDFYKWIETTNTWDNIKDGTGWDPAFETTFAIGRGYVYANSSGNVTKNFSGAINVADQPINLTVTSGQGNGWNLVGNPFASKLAANSGAQATNNLVDANTSLYESGYAALYFWNEQISDYEAINDASSVYFINPGQAFLIKAATNNSSYAINASMRKHGTSAFYKSSESDDVTRFTLTITGPQGDYNETMLGLIPEATNGLDQGFDAIKRKGNANIALYSKLVNGDPGDFAIQAISPTSENQVVPISLDANKTGTYTFSAGNADNMDNISVKLEDRLNNTFTSLEGSAQYVFTVLTASTIEDRFYLHFKSAVGIEEQQPRPKAIYSWGGNIYFETQGSATVEVFNMSGQKIAVRDFNTGGLQTLSINAPTGWYIVKMVSAKGVTNEKIFIN